MLHPAQLLHLVLVLAVAIPPLPDTNCCCAQSRDKGGACCKVSRTEASKAASPVKGCPRCQKAARLAKASQQQSGDSISRYCDCEKELREVPRLATTVRSQLRLSEVLPILFESIKQVPTAVQGKIFAQTDLPPPTVASSVQSMYCLWLI